MNERTIKSNLNLIHKILEGVEDDDQAALVDLYQSNQFDRIDHEYMIDVMQVAEFKRDFCKWINLLYHSPSDIVQGNGKQSLAFALSGFVRQG